MILDDLPGQDNDVYHIVLGWNQCSIEIMLYNRKSKDNGSPDSKIHGVNMGSI